MRKDATSKKFLIGKFNNYKTFDSVLAIEQLHEIEHLLKNFKQHNMNMDETIIVPSIIYKLPLTWKDFKRSFKERGFIS